MITFTEPAPAPARELDTTIGTHKVHLGSSDGKRWQACAWIGTIGSLPVFGYGDTPEEAVRDMAQGAVRAAEALATFAEAHAAAMGAEKAEAAE